MTLRDPTRLYEGDLSRRTDVLSRIISVVTYSPVLAAVLFPLLNATAGNATAFLVSTAVTFVTGTVLPAVVVRHYSLRSGNTDGDIVRREDRGTPLALGAASYLVGTVCLLAVDAPPMSVSVMLSYAACILVILAISSRWKISVHATGVAGPALVLCLVYPPWGLLAAILIPAVAWARYVRRKHTPLQLIAGTLLGLASASLALAPFL